MTEPKAVARAFRPQAHGASVTAIGGALGSTLVSNGDLASVLDTTDEWITERTGIRERRIGGTTVDLSTLAAARGLTHGGIDPTSIDVLLLATSTPGQALPAAASALQHALGLRCGAMDLNAACSGFAYALISAHGLIAQGAKRVLIVGADANSTITDFTDRSTAILFADGAGAVVLEADESADAGGLLAWHLDSDGRYGHILSVPNGGTFAMDGREVFRQAVRSVVASIEAVLDAAGLAAADVDAFVPHQANVRIVDAVNKRLGLDPERAVMIMDRTGNTSAGSIPLALGTANNAGRLTTGANVLVCGFGAGMTVGTALLRWGPALAPNHDPITDAATPFTSAVLGHGRSDLQRMEPTT